MLLRVYFPTEIKALFKSDKLRLICRMASKLDDIVGRLSNNDKSAIADLYTMCSARLYGIIYQMTTDADTARLALHDTFISIWKDRTSRKNTSDGHEDWLTAIAHHCAIHRENSVTKKTGSLEVIDIMHTDTGAVKQFAAKYGIEDNDLEFLTKAYFSGATESSTGKRQLEDPIVHEQLVRIRDLFGKTRT